MKKTLSISFSRCRFVFLMTRFSVFHIFVFNNISSISKKFAILLMIMSLSTMNVFAQSPSLEFASGGAITSVNGPTVANQLITFQRNTNNPTGNTFATQTPTQTVTFSLTNHQRTNVAAPGVGVMFGGNASTTSPNPVSFPIYQSMSSVGSANATHFRSWEGTSTSGSEGMDLTANYGVEILNSTRPLHESNAPLPTAGSPVVYQMADLVLTFNSPVSNPIVHFVGLGGTVGTVGSVKNTPISTEFTLISSGLTLTRLSGSSEFSVPSTTEIRNSSSSFSGTTGSGAGSGSVRVNGANITSITFRVFIKAQAIGGVYWSTSDNSYSGDGFLVSVSLSGIRPTGTVYRDNNGSATIDGGGTGGGVWNTANTLYVNAIGANGNVISSAAVAATGVYIFDSGNFITGDVVKFQLSKNQGVVGQPAPLKELPDGWATVGESTSGGVNDGTADGEFTVTLAAADLASNTVYRFGVTACPAGTVSPPVFTTLENACSQPGVNLNNAHTGTIPANTNLVWYTTSNRAAGTQVTGAGITAAGAGTYYAFYYSSASNCYSPASSAVVARVDTLDSDNDGVYNKCDLDDDNDGILDTVECGGGAIYNYSGFGLRSISTSRTDLYGFTGTNYTPVLLQTSVLGTADANHLATDALRNRILFTPGGNQGAISAYQFSTNSVVTVSTSNFLSTLGTSGGGGGMYNSDYYIYDDAGSNQGLFRVIFDANGNASSLSKVADPVSGFDLGDMAISQSGVVFINSGGSVYKLDLNALNLAVTAPASSWVSVGTATSATESQLFFGANGDLIGSNSGNLIKINPYTAANEGAITTNLGSYAWNDLSEAPTVGFSCGLDTDGDGIPNNLDLDSDNDGCPDSREGAGNFNPTTTASGPISTQTPNNNFGTDSNTVTGIPNAVGAGQGLGQSLNFSQNDCLDSDGDTIPDWQDLDDDNDGILDTAECSPVLANYTSATITGGTTNSATISGINFGGINASLTRVNNGTTAVNAPATGTFDMSNAAIFTPNGTATQPVITETLGGTKGSTFYTRYTLTLSAPVESITLHAINFDFMKTRFVGAQAEQLVSGGSEYAYNPATRELFDTDPTTYSSVTRDGYGSVRITSLNGSPITQIVFDRIDDPLAPFANDGFLYNFSIQPICDTDGDGVPNRLDLDSDGDGCPDAIEGAENVVTSQLNTNGSINTGLLAPNNGVGSLAANLGVPNLVNSGGSADTGTATVNTVGQPLGSSQNANINSCFVDAQNDINQVPTGVTATGTVLTNDKALDGTTVTVTSATYLNSAGVATALTLGSSTVIYDASGVQAGTITLNSNGTYTFIPAANYTGTVPVNYTISNTSGSTASATLSIEVGSAVLVPGNNNPIAQNDTGTAESGTNLSSNVLLNDSDPDANPLTLTTASVPLGTPTQVSGLDINGNVVANAGTLTLNANGTYTFSPAANFTGTVNPVTYTACDNAIPALCDTASLSIKVVPNSGNNTFANDDAKANPKGIPIITTAATGVLANDSDPEGNTQTVTSVNGVPINATGITNVTVSNGTLVFSANGSYTFTPNPTFVGTVVLPYTVCDSGTPQACDTATLYLTLLDTAVGVCYEDPTLVAGATYPVKHGITLLGRAGKVSTVPANGVNDWPMNKNSAYTALESKTKGFVVTRNSSPETTIAIPVVGMMVFDTDENAGAGCLKIYTGPGATEGWKCFSTQGCP